MRRVVLAVAPLVAGCAEGAAFDLEYPWVLGIAAIVAAAAMWQARAVPSAAFDFSSVDVVRGLPPSLRLRLRWLPAALRVLALVAATVAGARPQVEQFDERTVEGIDMFVALDMSGSMMAVDMSLDQVQVWQMRNGSEPPNRFDNAIATLDQFISHRTRDRIGMVVFARNAYLQFPLTLDYQTIQGLLARLELNAIDPSATAIGNAIGLAVRGLLDSTATSRAVILITDGKQQGGNISPIESAEIARDNGIAIYPILVGREGETLVPVGASQRGFMMQYRTENYPVDPALLQRIAQMTGGAFYRAEDREELERDLNVILDNLETTQMRDVTSTIERELFPEFCLAATILLALEALLASVWIRRYP